MVGIEEGAERLGVSRRTFYDRVPDDLATVQFGPGSGARREAG